MQLIQSLSSGKYYYTSSPDPVIESENEAYSQMVRALLLGDSFYYFRGTEFKPYPFFPWVGRWVDTGETWQTWEREGWRLLGKYRKHERLK